MSVANSPTLKVAFVHPDLGIGGAERLIVDAACGLRDEVGAHVHVFTSHHSRSHCFPETIDGRLPVTVYGDFFPRSLFGRFHVFFAVIRNLWLCLRLWVAQKLVPGAPRYDSIVVDQVSAGIPLLRATGAKILFYCHFPDKLLASRDSPILSLYRRPFDMLEEWTTKMADTVVVNSKFTASVFKKAFPSIANKPAVVYPGINFAASKARGARSPTECAYISRMLELLGPVQQKIIVSLNRFEPKKQVDRGILAFGQLVAERQKTLVVAGGYDERLAINRSTLESNKATCTRLGLKFTVLQPFNVGATKQPTGIGIGEGEGESKEQKEEVHTTETTAVAPYDVIFLPSIPEGAKDALWSRASALLYTPAFEHFGIVPVEAMYAQVPVVALASGGPAESITHLVTGYLCNSHHGLRAGLEWALLLTADERKELGKRSRETVTGRFSRQHMVQTLFELMNDGGRMKNE